MATLKSWPLTHLLALPRGRLDGQGEGQRINRALGAHAEVPLALGAQAALALHTGEGGTVAGKRDAGG
jgi:hypothetical protein